MKITLAAAGGSLLQVLRQIKDQFKLCEGNERVNHQGIHHSLIWQIRPGGYKVISRRSETFHMMFTKSLREGVRQGLITSSVRIWTRPKVKVGGRYRMEEGYIVVDSIESISLSDVTSDLARESGFKSVDDLLLIARHGSGNNVYLVRFHYLPPGVRDTASWRQGLE
jgi:hypothetical protein